MSKSILIVDDDEDIRAVLQVALSRFAGWRVVTAASGPEALVKAQQTVLDAILLDVSMPDMDGFSVFEQLQTQPLTQTIPVVLLTAKVLPGDRQRFRTMNVAGVITKPFNPLIIGAQIAALLGWDSARSSDRKSV